ncbi:endonuclease MutS2 [Fundicoccus culcitae]|uniref:Endonuclease MutS2 n=1 Tax=Fundicoccus culcitae TaxID=2969821 RepID=A0ABY5P8P0_9LACT|nr:endonuclease MutS2 [Fundicoccus culcitae]UUX35117.1 endonuclease MutS2 [Fundicoccus culcitae]
MNQNTYEKLEYDTLRDHVTTFCVSELGKKKMQDLNPSPRLDVVQNRLAETTQARAILDMGTRVPFMGLTSIDVTIDKVEKGMILSASELFGVADFLRGCRSIKQFMNNKAFQAPLLVAYAKGMTSLSHVEDAIYFAISHNRVDSQADKQLKKVRQQIETTEQKIKDRLNKYLSSSTYKNYIQEFVISVKDQRYTIPIKAAYKNQVDGTIVETSSRESTVFIEPTAVNKYNQELAGLRAEESMLEYQILATLTGSVAEYLREIQQNIDLIAHYDMVFAKAKYSKSIEGMEPRINAEGRVRLVGCVHPLLTGNVVPLDFEIGEDYRSLVITGPNAGGKTIVLKTIGLVTLAVMSGLHIRCEAGTDVAVFDKIFVDMGDNQSLENALSTFSSHMQNLSQILRDTGRNTLLLLDEIGSGTEPNEGAGLAIALLEEFYLKGALTVATTHYGEIKAFSEQHPAFMNAAMQFNQETLEPLYKLLIGQSGASNALWIARKMQIPEAVLDRAAEYIATKEYRMELLAEGEATPKKKVVAADSKPTVTFSRGDRVKLLDHDDFGLIYDAEVDDYNNVAVFYQSEVINVHVKRLSVVGRAADLYPADYDLETLFVDFQTRKFEHDLERGSKKLRRQMAKEQRARKKD